VNKDQAREEGTLPLLFFRNSSFYFFAVLGLKSRALGILRSLYLYL
jgi:hypothetical protein